MRWAKVFNLKQMAQTVNFLTEHNLLEYAVLEEKSAAATAHHNELSAKIKEAEKRMAEISVLRTHIINYAKTRDTYVAYRKAGYSKKFRQEHEEEILLHQAAKNAFDDMGVKKLPKVKELQAEYARLLEEKKKTYTEYRRSREEMRELLAAKANVDRLLNVEMEHNAEREKKATSSRVLIVAKSVRRTRSRRMKFCVHGGLGDTLNKQHRKPNGYPGALLASLSRRLYFYPKTCAASRRIGNSYSCATSSCEFSGYR